MPKNTGKELENRVAAFYRDMGAWKVQHDVELAGNQIDVYVELATPAHMLHCLAVEAKDWTSTVGVAVVNKFAEVADALRRAHLIDEGAIVSAVGFSRQARNAAKEHRITLLEPADLEQMVAEAKQAGRTRPTSPPIPKLPSPFFAHPYPLQANFTGRVREREMLTEWLTEDNRPVFALIAIGGMGKSALTWVWVNRDVLGLPLIGQPDDPPDVAQRCRVGATGFGGTGVPPVIATGKMPVPPDGGAGIGGTGVPPVLLEGVLWWSFYESQAGFDSFVRAAVAYASCGEVDPASILSTYDGCQMLLTLLGEKRILLVLDGLERILNAYTRLDAPYQGDDVKEDPEQKFRACADPHAAAFLKTLCATPHASRVLITSRLFPRELDYLMGCCRCDLHQFELDDGIAFFRAQGVRGTHAELEAQLRRYGLHPLALRLLSGMIVEDPARPGDIAIARDYDPSDRLVPREHHILKIAYDALTKEKQQLLSRLAAFRFPMDYAAVKDISNLPHEKVTKQALSDLVARGLLQRSQDTPPRFDLHPIVRQYAYDRLADKQGVHTRLHDYFDALPRPHRVNALDALQPVIELYYHTLRAGRVDEARRLYKTQLARRLYPRCGAYLTCVELLSSLFPDGQPLTLTGQPQVPQLREESDQTWTLIDLARSYAVCGQLRRALPLLHAHNTLCEKRGARRSLAIGLGCLAQLVQAPLGLLAASEQNARRSIALCHQIKEDRSEAIGRQDLARLLCYRGEPEAARMQLGKALFLFRMLDDIRSVGIVRSYQALRALLIGDTQEAASEAESALGLAVHSAEAMFPYEREFVRAEWLLGWSKVAVAAEAEEERDKLLAEAEGHLTKALTRCRRMNCVMFEPDILLAWGRWHRAKGNGEEARKHAVEGLAIADRCEYRLCQADIHNFLAQLALDEGDKKSALEHATIGRERAECDGEPHWYKPAVDEAERLLREARW